MARDARLGTPVRMSPNVKVIKVKPGSAADLSYHVEVSRRKRRKKGNEVLALMHEKYIGMFDTRLKCNCRSANITDHATARDPSVRRTPTHVYGRPPETDAEGEIEAFKAFHSYSCDACGAVYKASVIEGTRKYVPLELRPLEQEWRNQQIEALIKL